MDKNSIDYSSLEAKLNQKKFFKLSDVQHKLTKVAFDVVRFNDSENIDGLWQIQQGTDGEYIVAMYDEELSKSASTNWSVVANKQGDSLSVFYKQTPITRLAMARLGVPESEFKLVASYLPEKLANNSKLVQSLLRELPLEERQELLVKYPELQ